MSGLFANVPILLANLFQRDKAEISAGLSPSLYAFKEARFRRFRVRQQYLVSNCSTRVEEGTQRRKRFLDCLKS